MDFRDEIRRQRIKLAESALAVARELEAGRALAPFQEKLGPLGSAETDLPVRAAVLSADPEATCLLLSEIMGHDYSLCKIVVPSRMGLSEVLLQERGFLLDTGQGPREFEDATSFLAAVEQTHALQPADRESMEPLRLKLKAPAHLSGLCLLVPQNLEALVRKPALLSTLADQADWVFLAGTSHATLSSEQRAMIQLVLDQVTGLQNVLLPGANGDNGAVPVDHWSKNWKVALSLGTVRSGSDLLRNRLGLFTAPQSELRHYLVEARLLRQLEMTLALMEEELQQAQRQIVTRLSLAKDESGASSVAPDTRKAADALRSRLSEEAENLLRAAERDLKALSAPDAEFSARLQAAACDITSDDIEQTVGEVTIKLTLGEHISRNFAELLTVLLATHLTASLQQLREGLECSVGDAEKALEAATGARHKLNLALPDDTEIRTALGSIGRPELRYRSEMPRPTLGARFNAARQAIMTLMIAGTILGGLSALSGGSTSSGGDMRTLLAGLMLPLLVGGFLWTYVTFRKKDRQVLEKEVDRLHNDIYGELRRVMQDLLRDQHAAIAQHVQKSLRAVHQQIDAIFARVDQQRARDLEVQRKRGAEQQRSLEQRLGRLRDSHRQLTALQSRLPEARKTQANWLAAWITRFNQVKA